jgi:hypothetical protein
MDWLFKLVVIWLSLDVLIIATGWYAVKAIKPLFPNWWKEVIADNAPETRPVYILRSFIPPTTLTSGHSHTPLKHFVPLFSFGQLKGANLPGSSRV